MLEVFHLEISGKDNNLLQSLNKPLIFYIHLEISGKDVNEL